MSIQTPVIRQSRYQVRPEASVAFTVETKTGARLTFKVENCSLTGIGALLEGEMPREEGVEPGDILPAAKLVFGGQEVFLGRVVLRKIIAAEGRTQIGFSMVDKKVPIDGPLSRALATAPGEDVDPHEYELSPEQFNLGTFTSLGTNVDLFARCKQFGIFLAAWRKTPKFQYHRVRQPSKGTRVRLTQRRRGGRDDYVVMGSNDYLGLAAHPEVAAAAKRAIDEYGFGSTGSPLTTGVTKAHDELAHLVADIFGKERCLLFNSGYAANVGTLTGLTGAQDLILADILSHASLSDGMQMAPATTRFFKHNNVEHLQRLLEEQRAGYAGTLVVTEGAFSMDGDVAPLDKILTLARQHNARVFVDEAHSFGVLGTRGLGACDKFDVLHDVDIIMGTFSKIAGGIGGFIVADAEVVDWLNFYARAHMFSVSLPPSTAAAALAALKIFQREPERVARLHENVRHFVFGLRALGYPIPSTHDCAIVPVVIGDERKLGLVGEELLQAGVYVVPIVYPAVSRTGARFRFTVTSEHTVSDLDYVLNVLERALAKAEVRFEGAIPGANLKVAA
jgi:glycine C-acetyltransferase